MHQKTTATGRTRSIRRVCTPKPPSQPDVKDDCVSQNETLVEILGTLRDECLSLSGKARFYQSHCHLLSHRISTLFLDVNITSHPLPAELLESLLTNFQAAQATLLHCTGTLSSSLSSSSSPSSPSSSLSSLLSSPSLSNPQTTLPWFTAMLLEGEREQLCFHDLYQQLDHLSQLVWQSNTAAAKVQDTEHMIELLKKALATDLKSVPRHAWMLPSRKEKQAANHKAQVLQGVASLLQKLTTKTLQSGGNLDHDSRDTVGVIKLQEIELLNGGEANVIPGRGCFGPLTKGHFRGAPVAVREMCWLSKEAVAQEETTIQLVHENVNTLLAVALHPNILYLYGFSPAFNIPSQTFPSIISQQPIGHAGVVEKIPQPVVFSLLFELAAGLCFLHERSTPIVHADICPQNVVFMKPGFGNPKLAGFGCKPINALAAKDQANVAYKSPELLRKQPCSCYSDIYAFGMLSHRLLAGSLPFDSTQPQEILIDVLKGVPRLSRALDLNWFSTLVETCWREAPLTRPSAAGVMHSLRQRLS
eukprot:m.238987 g.238987  ORF g.238987 m.238987 type:complete len:532 (+) comp26571_c0_seq8:176-1771(+)